ncbi:MAG: hypothetical protein H8Z69_02825 [Nanohaloarchaea archaeon]|nr:hypothetical protein [Candidatus Nanohaloarchaea archaeon]
MVLDQLIGFGFQWVEQSWIFSTIIVKYFLVAVGVDTLIENQDLDYYLDSLIDYSENVVIVVTGLGLLNIFAGYGIEAVLPIVSQVVTLLYFAFLFWKF